MGDDSSLDEWLRAEARVLNLDRTPWHMTWVGVRPQRARRRLDRARVSARTLPVERSWSFRRRAPRHRCQPCLRGSRLSSRVPPALSLSASRLGWRHALDEGSPADGNVSRAGDECGGVGVGTERRFDEARLAGAPHESVQTCHTPLASEVSRRPSRDSQEMPPPPRNSAYSAFGSCSTEAVGCRSRCCIAQSAPTRICSICSICSIRVQAAKSVVLKYACFAILRHLYVGGMAVLCRLSRSIAVRGGRTPVSGYRAHWALLQQYGYLALPQCESLSGMAVWR